MQNKSPLFILCLLSVSAAVPAAPLEERFDSAGVTIRFVSSGQGEPVVLLHGFGGSADTAWVQAGTFDAIADAGFHVIAIDHRGHGQSDKPHSPLDYGSNMAEDVARLLDHLEISAAHVVGYSMGAKIANTFRSLHPQRTISLTLGGYGWPWRSIEVTLDIARESMAQRELLPGNDLDALAAYQVRANELVPAEADLRANKVPTLSLVGTEDIAMPRADVETLRRTMSKLTSVDMPGTHAGQDGALYKAQFGAEIVRFLQQHSAH